MDSIYKPTCLSTSHLDYGVNIKIQIGDTIYTYNTSQYFTKKFLSINDHSAWKALSYLKKHSTLIETIRNKNEKV